MSAPLPSPVDILRRHWGYDSFRPLQQEIIESVLDGHDTLALLPTGGGKSITFQVPALMLPRLTLVVTPLISLMKDQVDNLKARHIGAACLHWGMTRREANLTVDKCIAGRVKLLYVSPEKLGNATFRQTLKQIGLSLVVVDEAHCISQWGYDFRPAYMQIARVREVAPDAPVLALTASATPEVAEDIMRSLGFSGRRMFARSFTRSNISFVVRPTAHKEHELLSILNAVNGSSIVYVRSRRRTREIAQWLQQAGVSADFYHAGLDTSDKSERQERWKKGFTRVMVATNAFGMGIDKPDVRLVVHIDLPPSLEEYYQEAGRAGRDGLEAYAVLLVNDPDKAVLTRRLTEAFPPKEYIREVYQKVGDFLQVAVGDGYDRAFGFDFNRFCFLFKMQPVPVHSSLQILSRLGYLLYDPEPGISARAMVLADKRELYNLQVSADADAVLQTLLRSYTGLFSDYVDISEQLIASRCSLSEQRVYEALLELGRAHALHYIPRRTVPSVYWPTSRELPKHLLFAKEVYEMRREAMKHRLDAVREFAFARTGCRVAGMLAYFGEKDAKECGKCDLCRARRVSTPDISAIDDAIIYLCRQPGSHTPDYIVEQLCPPHRPADVVGRLRLLADRGLVALAPM